ERCERVADSAEIAAGDQDQRQAKRHHHLEEGGPPLGGHHDSPPPLRPPAAGAPPRGAARSGETGSRNRHGEVRSISSAVTGRPSASSRMPGSLVAALAGSNPLTIGLVART